MAVSPAPPCWCQPHWAGWGRKGKGVQTPPDVLVQVWGAGAGLVGQGLCSSLCPTTSCLLVSAKPQLGAQSCARIVSSATQCQGWGNQSCHPTDLAPAAPQPEQAQLEGACTPLPLTLPCPAQMTQAARSRAESCIGSEGE